MMKKSEPIALVDLDGTLADYNGAMTTALKEIASPEDSTTPISIGKFAPPHLRARQMLIRSQPGWWRNLPKLEKGFEILDALRELDFQIHILTKGPHKTTNAWSEKVEWCQKHVPDASIVITQDKGLVYGKVLVDDWPEYVERWLEWRPRGYVIMPNQLWNSGFEHPNVRKYGSPECSTMAEIKKALAVVRATAA